MKQSMEEIPKTEVAQRTELAAAITNHDEATALELINRSAPWIINEGVTEDATFLHLAIRAGKLAICLALLEKMSPATIQALYYRDHTVLHLAAQEGHQTICELLLTRMSPEAIAAQSTENRQTALHLAAQEGHQAICELLLTKMSSEAINATIKDYTGSTALCLAARGHHQELCQVLINFMPLTELIDSVDRSASTKAVVRQIVEQFTQQIFPTEVIALDHAQLKLLKLSQVLDHRIDQVNCYITKHYFELMGVCHTINLEAPIAALAPIYNDYMAQVLAYLPRNLFWSTTSNIDQEADDHENESNSGLDDSKFFSYEDEGSRNEDSELLGANDL